MGFAIQLLDSRPEGREDCYRRLAEELVSVSIRINQAKDQLRRSCSLLAGCSLEEWTVQDLMAYADLAMATYAVILSDKE